MRIAEPADRIPFPISRGCDYTHGIVSSPAERAAVLGNFCRLTAGRREASRAEVSCAFREILGDI